MVIPKTEVLVSVGGTVRARQEVAPGEYDIGCDPACAIHIETEQIAGHHARLTVNYSDWLIEDLGSAAGTRVGGEPVTEPRRIFSGQHIELGTAIIELRRVHGHTEPGASLPPDMAAVRALLPEGVVHGQRYAIGKVVAHGGMGAILDARDGSIARQVAMKIMLATGSEDHAVRFVQEAQITGQLEHPNIVPVHELSVDEHGQPFYTMKMVRGVTLKDVVARLAEGDAATVEKYPLAALLTAFQKVCDAVAFAHSKGVIHRDLKPENLMLGDFGEVLVMDWGLAKILGKDEGGRMKDEKMRGCAEGTKRSAEGPSTSSFIPHPSSFTLDGTILGTPQYMSPEQARGEIETLDARTDIYALGAILYSILTLRPPVEGTDAQEIVAKVARGEILDCGEFSQFCGERKLASAGGTDGPPQRTSPPHPKAPTSRRTPQSLAAVVRKAMALDRDARYPSVADLQADITAYQTGFATAAEHAGLLKQLALLIVRHRREFTIGFAAWLIITALAVWFVLHLRASERETRRQAEIALANEKRAEANEQRALAEKEKVRRALTKSALALAEAAYREADGQTMQAALEDVPADLRDANWRYLREQSDTSIARINAGSNVIRSVAAHPKLPGVFAVSDDKKKITILEARTGVRLLQFPCDPDKDAPGAHFKIAVSPDGERIAVGKAASTSDPGGGIAILNARDGMKRSAWPSTGVFSLEFSPDGQRLLQQSANTSLNLWDASNGKLLWKYKPDLGPIRGVITPDGHYVLAGLRRGTLVALKMEDGTESRTLDQDLGTIQAMAIHPDGVTVLWCDATGNVAGLDLRDGRMIFSRRAHPTRVEQVAFTPDGERFASVSQLPDGRQSIQISSARTGAPLQSLIGGIGRAATMAVHPLTGELLIGGQNSRLWDIAGTPAKWVLPSRSDGGTLGGAFFLSTDLFLGPSKGYRVALLDLHGPSTLWNPTNGVFHMATASADCRFFALGSSELNFRRIQVLRQLGKTVEQVGAFPASGNFAALRLSPTGDRLALASNGKGKQTVLLEPATGKELVALDNAALHEVNDLHWIAGGTELIGLATANRPRGVTLSEEQIIVWHAATGQRLRTAAHPTALDCLAVAPDGQTFAAAGADKLVHVFDTATLAERQTFRAHDGPITALAWHPTRPILATGSDDLTIKLWNLDTGQRLDTLRGPTGPPRVLNFSPSGQRLACASTDRTVRIWEPSSLKP